MNYSSHSPLFPSSYSPTLFPSFPASFSTSPSLPSCQPPCPSPPPSPTPSLKKNQKFILPTPSSHHLTLHFHLYSPSSFPFSSRFFLLILHLLAVNILYLFRLHTPAIPDNDQYSMTSLLSAGLKHMYKRIQAAYD